MNNSKSAVNCGCDEGANHYCANHEPMYGAGAVGRGGAGVIMGFASGEGSPQQQSEPVVEMDVEDVLREFFPHGHPQFLPITLKEMELHSQKNNDYAAGGAPTGNFDRVAAILALYPKLKLSDRRVVALVYALKQLDAVLWGINSDITHKVEGLNARLQDISVYAKIVMCLNLDAGTEGK
jgi:hypothetical protein